MRTLRRAPRGDAMRESIIEGLGATPKVLPSTLLYDDRGAELFEQITAQPEYYVARTEQAILDAHAADLADLMGPRVALIELGSGAATKVRPLLAALQQPTAYVPVDVAHEQLMEVAEERAREFPRVPVQPVWANYSDGLTLPDLADDARRVAFFPGTTIGNLEPEEASDFLQQVRSLVGADGGMIIGVDRRKDPRVLNAAYNDAAGRTAEFNLNVLVHLNREHRGTFDRTAFVHRAFFNDAQSRIEMHLEAIVPHAVQVAGEEFSFIQRESVRTAISYKFDRARLDAMAASGGWEVKQLFTDARDWFWVAWLCPVAGGSSYGGRM
ncbi:MAG TPA: L-histidine N(alpha)-methyltransferase [Gemmatimonadaceae bacterium]|nr:L-histidine N(alpha)-methyltransferase [Gemmatimonadaceae bacterium]